MRQVSRESVELLVLGTAFTQKLQHPPLSSGLRHKAFNDTDHTKCLGRTV